MTDKNDALFLVRLPFGQKTIPYEEVPELIAMAKSPGYDGEKASEHEAVMLALGVCQEEGPLRAAVQAGEVEVLDKSLHRMTQPFNGRLKDTVLTVQALREYVESIKGFLEVEDAPEPQAVTPSPIPLFQAYAEQLANRRAANCYDIHEAAQAIALQLGLNEYRTEKLRDDMGQAAFDGALTVRSTGGHDQYAPTSPPKTTYGFDSLTTPDDVNKWATERRFTWRWLSEPQATTPSPAPVAIAKRSEKKPSIETVALDYMRAEFKQGGQFQSASKFHKHLIKTAGLNTSPFEIGTGINARKLFCPVAGSFFNEGTLGKMWAKIRAV